MRLCHLIVLALLCSTLARAENAGLVTHLSGVLTARHGETVKVLSVKSEVVEGDLLTTEEDTYARIKFADGGEVVLRPTSQLQVQSYSFNPAKPESDSVVLNMLKGGLRMVTGLVGKRSREKVMVSSEISSIGLRGTHFGALLCNSDCANVPTVTGRPPSNGLHVDVVDGAIVLFNGAGQQQINAGQFGYVQSPQMAPRIVPPSQGIQVTMPPAISQNNSRGQGIGQAKEDECSL